MQLRREKGLCFTCDEKYTWNHKCPNLQYMLLLLDFDDSDLPTLVDLSDEGFNNSLVCIAIDHHLTL